MMGITHMAIAATGVSLILQTADAKLLLAGAITSLLPDVDTSRSFAGQVLRFASRWLERRFPHRSCTHSLVASGMVALATYPLATWTHLFLSIVHAINLGFFLGYLADAFTATGCEMFWPSSVRCVWPGNRNFRLKTGSPIEHGVLVVLLFLLVSLININAHGGIITQFNRLIGTPNGVAQIYNEQGNSHLIVAHIKGVMASDRAPVSEDFWIISSQGKDFIVQSKTGEIYQAGNEPDSQLIINYVTADAGPEAITKLDSISLDLDEVLPKLSKLSQLGAMVFVSGELKVEHPEEVHFSYDPSQFPTLKKNAESIILSLAPLKIVLKKLGDQLATGELSIKSIYVQNTSAIASSP